MYPVCEYVWHDYVDGCDCSKLTKEERKAWRENGTLCNAESKCNGIAKKEISWIDKPEHKMRVCEKCAAFLFHESTHTVKDLDELTRVMFNTSGAEAFGIPITNALVAALQKKFGKAVYVVNNSTYLDVQGPLYSEVYDFIAEWQKENNSL